jgi:hypothetical protein
MNESSKAHGYWISNYIGCGARGGVVVKALRYKPAGIGIFQ